MLILFDVDGTLVDSERVLLESQRRTLARHGLTHPGRLAGLAIVGLSLPQAFAALVGPGEDIEGLCATYREEFFTLRQDPAYDSPLYDGAEAVIAALSRRPEVTLGLATGKSRRGVAHLVERHGWHAHFATIQTADTNPSKPDPGMVLAAMAETGATPEETLVVGDTAYDMQMARAAGADAIGVSWGFHRPNEILAAGARAIVDRFDDLLPLIDHAERRCDV